MALVPPFDPNNSRYDQGTFSGRLKQICAQLDPLKLLVSNSSVMEAVAAVDHFREHKKGPEGWGDEELWAAKELMDARTHPDTKELIFRPLCFAAYCPMQPPIILGMVWPGAGPMNQAFWQWYNSTFNAAVFYANRNASSEVSNTDLGIAYAGALVSSVGVGAGLVKLGASLEKKGPAGRFARAFAPFAGTVCGGVITLLCMRWKELVEGVDMRDEQGKVYGKSVVAAREGIAQCAAARVIWNIPIFVLTPVINARWRATALAASLPALAVIAVETVLATCNIAIGIYPAQAMFTQHARIPASRLEPEFAATGVNTFVYNKGL